MKKYTLKNVERMYSFYGRGPFMYKLSNFLVFLGKEEYLLNIMDLGSDILAVASGLNMSTISRLAGRAKRVQKIISETNLHIIK